MNTTWTDKQRETCLKLYRAGIPSKLIAETIGKTNYAVKRYIGRRRKEEPDKWRRVERKRQSTNKTGKPKAQKCETCFYASGATKNGWKCPWVAPRFEPIPGWDAEQVVYRINDTASGCRYDITYAIHDCPRYERG